MLLISLRVDLGVMALVSNSPQPASPVWCNTQTPEMLIK